jgi:hypothetical protein
LVEVLLHAGILLFHMPSWQTMLALPSMAQSWPTVPSHRKWTLEPSGNRVLSRN